MQRFGAKIKFERSRIPAGGLRLEAERDGDVRRIGHDRRRLHQGGTVALSVRDPEDYGIQTVEWVVSFEREIASASWSGAESRNYQQQYNPYNVP